MENGDRRTCIGGVRTDPCPLSSDFRPLTSSGRRPHVCVCLWQLKVLKDLNDPRNLC